MALEGGIVLAGAVVGLAVGLTGTGGGALVTPVLVLLLGVSPGAAVASDLVASLLVKPVASIVHLRRRTVHWPIVRRLVTGSVPAAFAGACLEHALGSGPDRSHAIDTALGAALLLAAVGVVARTLLYRRGRPRPGGRPVDATARPAATVVVGALGGVVVGMTSVGSGSLMVVALMFLYPDLTGRELVGTDLVQSVPLVASASLGQALFGDVSVAVTLSLLVGALPATYLGARLSSARATDALLRPAITAVLALSALKLLGAGERVLEVALVSLAATGATVAALALRRARRGPVVPGAEA